jgi:S1-C subfamily serine protease
MASSLVSLSNDFASVVEQTAAAVVAVHSRPRFNSSGVHWSPGIVVVAEHTLRHEENISVSTGTGEELAAEVVGRDPGTDLAVLRAKDLTVPIAARLEGGGYRSGNLVLAVGRKDEGVHASIGVIASIAGPSQTSRGGKLDEVIRLDLSLHPVASGAAIVDAAGKVIGIGTPALSTVAVFAVPNATVERVVRTLVAHGRIPQGYLGAGLQPISLPEHLIKSLGLTAASGLMTVSVDQDAPAGKAGLFIGDVLVDLDGQPVRRPEGIRSLLSEAVGKTLSARVVRGGVLVNLEIRVAERRGRS